MYKAFILFFFFINASFLKAQTQFGPNLVYNGGFEILDSCPTGASGWYIGYLNLFPGWKNPNGNSPDNFHRCAPLFTPNGYFGASVPKNFWGYQEPHSGDGYGGFGFATFCCGSEYLQSKLIENLVPNQKYCIDFYLSRGDYLTYASNQIGIHFSKDSIHGLDTGPFLDISPQFTTGNRFITDTNSWEHFQGSFIADSNYSWITIGRFDTLSSNEFIDLNYPNPAQAGIVYYFIDDIAISKCNSFQIPNIFTPNNDGKNDHFEVVSELCPELMRFFNRWGEQLIELKNTCKWDGKIDGSEVTEGIYYYLIMINGEYHKGFVQLIR